MAPGTVAAYRWLATEPKQSFQGACRELHVLRLSRTSARREPRADRGCISRLLERFGYGTTDAGPGHERARRDGSRGVSGPFESRGARAYDATLAREAAMADAELKATLDQHESGARSPAGRAGAVPGSVRGHRGLTPRPSLTALRSSEFHCIQRCGRRPFFSQQAQSRRASRGRPRALDRAEDADALRHVAGDRASTANVRDRRGRHPIRAGAADAIARAPAAGRAARCDPLRQALTPGTRTMFIRAAPARFARAAEYSGDT